jgi:hypothetical protein
MEHIDDASSTAVAEVSRMKNTWDSLEGKPRQLLIMVWRIATSQRTWTTGLILLHSLQ